jgi:hypothetical protein
MRRVTLRSQPESVYNRILHLLNLRHEFRERQSGKLRVRDWTAMRGLDSAITLGAAVELAEQAGRYARLLREQPQASEIEKALGSPLTARLDIWALTRAARGRVRPRTTARPNLYSAIQQAGLTRSTEYEFCSHAARGSSDLVAH